MNKQIDQQSLHPLMDAYSDYATSTSNGQSPSCYQRQSMIRRLKTAHADVPLASLGFNQIQLMIDHWRSRPVSTKTGKPIAIRTANTQINELFRFLLWLDTSPDTPWVLPPHYHRLNKTLRHLESDFRQIRRKRSAYTLDELRLLYQNAERVERAVFLLGLNCGFGPAEIGRIRINDIRFQGHDTDDVCQAAIVRHRQKTWQAGVWELWPETVEAIQDLLSDRADSDGFLFVLSNGKPMYQEEFRNPNVRLFRLWRRLSERVREQSPTFPQLPLATLRLTAAELIHARLGDEVARSFLGYSPSRQLQYYTDKSAEMAHASHELRECLAPVFA